jgi:hypothetical protein
MSTETNTAEIQLIDVKQRLHQKCQAGKTASTIHIRYLKRIVHQNEINDFLKRTEIPKASIPERSLNELKSFDTRGNGNITDNTD